MAFGDYRGLQVRTVAPTGTGGLPLHNDLKELADRAGPIHSAATDPTIDDDENNNAGNGKFYLWSKWLNTVDKSLFVCADSTPTAAIWRRIFYGGIIDVALFSNKVAFTQTDENEYIDSLNDGYLDYGATIAHRFLNHVKLTGDDRKIRFGIDDNASIYYDAVNMVLNPKEVGAGLVSIISDLRLPTDGDKIYLGANIADYTIQWDGNDAVHTITTGDFVFTGGYVGIGTATPQNNLHILCSGASTYTTPGRGILITDANGPRLIFEDTGEGNDDKIMLFRYEDERLYVSSLSDTGAAWDVANIFCMSRDGDIGVGVVPTQKFDVNGITLARDKIAFTQADLNEYIDSLNDGYLDLNATTSVRTYSVIQQSSSTSGGGLQQCISEAVGTAAAAQTFNIEVNIPSGAKILGCQLRVDTLLTSGDGGVSWEAEYVGGVVATLGGGYAFAKDTQAMLLFDTNAAVDVANAEVDIKITCNAAKNFQVGGQIRAIVYYQELIPMDAAP
jgi:hypothetical protein